MLLHMSLVSNQKTSLVLIIRKEDRKLLGKLRFSQVI